METRRNRGYCEYHRDYGHTTEHCLNLARPISQVTNDKRVEPLKLPKINQELLIQGSEKDNGKNEGGIEETIFVIMGGEESEVKGN